ncbi:hypothetical protein GCM10023116_19450 [Kistimonas scapharcae]|uniref:Uncharacterized protein n=1 Tax=Kistimonas scapharcae TaxID=1036133 RepID=A0ABP8V465_9GAMM
MEALASFSGSGRVQQDQPSTSLQTTEKLGSKTSSGRVVTLPSETSVICIEEKAYVTKT